MRRLLLSILVVAFGCGGEIADTAKALEGLSTDPWEGIYAVQQIDSNHFYVNPVVAAQIQCPDGYWLDRCLVAKVNLAYTGLSLTVQNNVRARLPGEPPYESSVSLLMKEHERATSMAPARSGWVKSTPPSITPTVTPDPVASA